MQKLVSPVASLAAAAVGLVVLAGQASFTGPDEDLNPREGIATLYVRDPLAQTFSFGDGEYGGVFQDHMKKNRASDIDFGCYNAGAFTVGIEGGRRGAIIDLGSTTELKARYGYVETVGAGQGFASIHREEDAWVILDSYEDQTFQPLEEASQLSETGTTTSNAPVEIDHLYIARWVNRHDADFERLVKLLVIAHSPGETVTIRWERLD